MNLDTSPEICYITPPQLRPCLEGSYPLCKLLTNLGKTTENREKTTLLNAASHLKIEAQVHNFRYWKTLD